MRNVRPSSAWLGDGVYCLHAEKSRDSVSFCELSQTKPNQHAAGHRHTGGNVGLWMLSNSSISHHINWRRHFMRYIELSACSSVIWVLSSYLAIINCTLELVVPTISYFLHNLHICVFLFTFHAGCLVHGALFFLCLWSAGLWGYKARGGIRAVDLWNGCTNPRLRAFLKSTCFILLHTGTPLAPLTQFALISTLT